MRKAQKRELGRQRQAVNREESRLSGLMAQERDQKLREKQYQDALIARDKRSKKVIPENEGNSKLAREKRERVAARGFVEAVMIAGPESAGFLGDESFDLDLSTVDC